MYLGSATYQQHDLGNFLKHTKSQSAHLQNGAKSTYLTEFALRPIRKCPALLQMCLTRRGPLLSVEVPS